jgi:hypothetical protein
MVIFFSCNGRWFQENQKENPTPPNPTTTTNAIAAVRARYLQAGV